MPVRRSAVIASGWGAWATQFALVLALFGCPAEPPPAVLGATPTLLGLVEDDATHLTITANAAAVRQANQGLHVWVQGPVGRDDLFLRVLPDLVELDDLAIRDLERFGRSTAAVVGGDVRALCAAALEDGTDCQLGFTVTVTSASGPADLTSEIGLARSGVAGVFGCGSEPRAFDASARVDVAFD